VKVEDSVNFPSRQEGEFKSFVESDRLGIDYGRVHCCLVHVL